MKVKYYKQLFKLFLKKVPPTKLIEKYVNKTYSREEFFEFQDFCSSNTKIEWVTGLSIIEAVERIYKDAIDNDNIQLL